MTHELFYTSAERGLDLGAYGFCTVKRTRGLPKRLERLLTELSVYRAVYPPNDPRFDQNPVIFTHCRVNLDGQMLSVLSRIGAAPPDYSGRSNYFAHHVVLSAAELPAAGPVWLAQQRGFLATHWDGKVEELASGRLVPRGEIAPRRCTTWERLTGDASWAGVVLKFWTENPTTPFYLIVDPGMPVLELLGEVIALLPPEKRWSATFTTQYIYIPGGVTCAGRVVLADSDKLGEAKASSRCLDLRTLQGKRPPDDPYTEAARTGQHVRISEQYTFAQDEPTLPISGESFGQVQVAGPIRHSPGVAPASGVLPPPPPSAAPQKRASSSNALWLTVLTLLQIATIGLFAALLLISRRDYNQLLASINQQQPAHHQSDEPLAEKSANELREQIGSLSRQSKEQVKSLEKQLTDLQSQAGQLIKTYNQLAHQLKDTQEQIKSTLDRLGELRKELENIRNQTNAVREVVQEHAQRDYRRWLGQSLQNLNNVKDTPVSADMLKKSDGRIVVCEGPIWGVIVLAPNAKAGQKVTVLSENKPHILDPVLGLRVHVVNDPKRLIISWTDKKKPEECGKNLDHLTLIVFSPDGIQAFSYKYIPSAQQENK